MSQLLPLCCHGLVTLFDVMAEPRVLQWFDEDNLESLPFPLGYEESLDSFNRLILMRCFRVDRIYRAVTEYVTSVMGEKYVMPPIISFESIFEQSSPISPIVFILSPGSDPASDLLKLADRSGFGSNKLKYLSLGQGQEKVSTSTCLWGQVSPSTSLWGQEVSQSMCLWGRARRRSVQVPHSGARRSVQVCVSGAGPGEGQYKYLSLGPEGQSKYLPLGPGLSKYLSLG